MTTLGWIIKLGLLFVLVAFLVENPGDVTVRWFEYSVTIHIAFFTAIILLTVGALLGVMKLISFFIHLPRKIKKYRSRKNQEKGKKALIQGFTALAENDRKKAIKKTMQAGKKLGVDDALFLLLNAQTARLEGDDKEAKKSFEMLLENKEAKFLGMRGLLQLAAEGGDNKEAVRLAGEARKLFPKNPWVLKTAYQIEIQARAWDEALIVLKSMKKNGVIDKNEANCEEQAILIAKGDEEKNVLDSSGKAKESKGLYKKAVSIDKSFIPAALRLSDLYIKEKNTCQAKAVLKKAWSANPHPDLLKRWFELPKGKKENGRLSRYKALYKMNPKNALVNHLAGVLAMDESLWGEAERYFLEAERLNPTASLYRDWARLAELSGKGYEDIRRFQDLALDSNDNPVWICRLTGRIYPEWLLFALPHGSFNTIVWERPSVIQARLNVAVEIGDREDNLLSQSVKYLPS